MIPSIFGAETVTVVRFEEVGVDELGNPIREKVPENVDGVLVAVGPQGEPSETNRPDGVTVAYTLYFPKTFTGEVDNCGCVVRGHYCEFTGHSDRYTQSPNPWNMKCEVKYGEG